MMGSDYEKRQLGQRFEGAHDLLHDARVIMTDSLAHINDGIDLKRVLAAIERVDQAQKRMHQMALETYKSEGIEP
jgi:hypothetical protein